ncbi:hypothetical protein NHX12_017647 [Muraenolepis orangiensis]|uniref:Uncharacterized protein n=1 Tax=Muraenolepis orangiensis TaxID=630683 RepID=A0A9Q0EVB5_9TELE|nr:hypothetical protein NHX12_017647 [Muraenolepis orangiensis]
MLEAKELEEALEAAGPTPLPKEEIEEVATPTGGHSPGGPYDYPGRHFGRGPQAGHQRGRKRPLNRQAKPQRDGQKKRTRLRLHGLKLPKTPLGTTLRMVKRRLH